MYDNLRLILNDRVGFKQERKSKRYAPLSSDLLTSSTGIEYNELSPKFLSLKSLSESFDLYEGEDLDLYDVAISYSIGDQVKTVDANGVTKAFISLTDLNLGNDVSDGANWESILEHELKDIRDKALTELLYEMDDKFQLEGSGKEIMEYTPLFNRSILRPKVMAKTGQNIGMSFQLSSNLGLKVELNKIMFWYNTAETLIFNIYHTSSNVSLDSFEIDVVSTDRSVSYTIDKKLDYIVGDVKGSYYVVVDETTLTGDFYGYDYNGGEPCQTCPNGHYDRLYWGRYTKYFWASPVAFSGDFSDQGEYITNIPNRSVFNFITSAKCDFENFYIENVSQFDRLIQHKVAIKVLSYMLESERVNFTDENLKSNIEKVLKGYTEKEFTQGEKGGKEVEVYSDGLIPKYNKLLEKLRLNTESICSECSPNTNPFSVVF